MAHALQVEIDRNFDAFMRQVGTLTPRFRGWYAVLHKGEIAKIVESVDAAMAEGYARYPDGMFSVQEVTDEPVDLGFYTHAVDIR